MAPDELWVEILSLSCMSVIHTTYLASNQLGRVSNDWYVKTYVTHHKSIYWVVKQGWDQVAKYRCKISNNKQNDYKKLLNAASYLGNIVLVRCALENLKHITPSIVTNALNFASEQGHSDIVKLLFEHVVNVKLCNKSYLLACKRGHKDIVRFYLEHGIDVNCFECRPLFHAIEEDHLDVVKLLIEKGVNVQEDDCNALLIAAKVGDSEMFSLLLTCGCDINEHNIIVGGEPVENNVVSEVTYYGHLNLLNIINEYLG